MTPVNVPTRLLGTVRRHRKALLSLAVVAGIAVLAATQHLDLSAALPVVERFTTEIIVLSLALATVQNGLQSSRLWVLLGRQSRPGWAAVLRAFSLGQLLNNYVPARAGDLLKIVLLRPAARDGAERDVPGSAAAVASIAGPVLLADKLADVGSLLLLVLILAPQWLADLKIPAPAALATASALLALLAISLVVASRWWSGLRAVARAALGSAIASVRSPRFVAALGFGGLSWLAEAVILRGLASAAGHPLTVAQALWALIVLNLGIAVPVVVANLVTFEASLALGLSRFDVPAGTALAIGLAHHLVQALSVVGLVVVREIAGTFPRHATSFLVREIDKSRAITHYHRLSDRYDRAVTRGPLRYLREREHQAVLRFARFDDRSKATVLDVGCGGGVFSLAAKRAGLHVSSVDLAPGMVQKIGGQVDEAWVGDVETLQLPRRYDIVICSGVLDFVLNPEVAFENLAALVAPGGRLVVNAPRSGPWGWIYRMEKAALGIRVNLFSRAWFERQSQRCRIRLRDTIRPLPTNEVVLFEHPGS